MANSNTHHNIEKLRGRENFETWSRQAKSYLVIKGLWKSVEKKLTTSSSAADIESDQKALAEISLMIEPYNFGHIEGSENAHDAWKQITKAFESSGLTRKVELLKSLTNMKLSDFDSMKDYVNSFVMTSFQCKNAGFNLDNELLASLMLAGLPSECDSLVLAIENQKEKLELDKVKNTLLQDKKFDKDENNGGALFSKGKQKQFKCHICGKIGHFARTCIQNKKKKNQSKKNKSERSEKDNVLFAAMLATHEKQWYIDSGATSHMTKSNDLLSNVNSTVSGTITIANSESIDVKSAGDVSINLDTGKPATLKNVKFVPNICANLVSVSQMAKCGNKVVFEGDTCEIYNSNRDLISVSRMVNDLYPLNCVVNETQVKEKAMVAVKTMDIWHRRMGHICDNNLMKVKNSSIGIDFKPQSDREVCKVCAIGKQSRAPFKEKGTRAKSLLQIIHSDVCGPLPIKSFSGAKYFVTFVDDFSRHVTVVPIKQKSQVFSEFVKYKNLAENQLSRKIKIYRSDNGTEFINNQFDKHLSDVGIKRQTSAPYVHEQLGVAERINRTLMERVRCMLADAGLPKSFWAEAVTTAAYLLNRIPCREETHKTPLEYWTGEKPNLSHLRVFGSSAMVHVPKEKRDKLDPKSIECILLGYSDQSKAYRLYNKATRKITISRDVIFCETDREVIDESHNDINSVFSPIESDISNSGDEREDESINVSLELNQTVQEQETSAVQPNDESNITVTSDVSVYDDAIADDTFVPEETMIENAIEENAGLRQSTRIANRRQEPNYLPPSYSFSATEQSPSDEPWSVKEALSRNDAHLWKAALGEEMKALATNETWSLVNLPRDRKAIPCKWVFKTKLDAHGNVTKHKARLVAKGCSQKQGIDFKETFAPVVRYNSIRYLIALSAKLNLEMHQMDAVTAFLNGELKEEIYMHQPDGFNDNSGRVCKLQKSLYGLKQSSRVWNEKLNAVLLKYGLKRSEADQCIYHHYSDGKLLIVAIYVDDVLICCNDIHLLNEFKRELSNNFQMKDLGEATSILGMRIIRDRKNGTISIDQIQYLNGILQRFGMSDCNGVSTPLDVNQKLSAKLCPTTEKEKNEMVNIPYMQLIGCLLFAAQVSRPDINFAVNLLSRYNTNPGKAHWGAAKRVLRYIKSTINRRLVYSKSPTEIEGFCDADWAGDLDKRSSTTAYVFTFQGAAISWMTRRQKTIALSSTESEYMSMVAAIKEAVWLKRLDSAIFPNASKCIKLNCDNKSAMSTATNNSYSDRTKHVDVKGSFINQKIEEGQIELAYLSTDKMVADFLTKATNHIKQQQFSNDIGLVE